jgi:hypothetical protein
MTANYKHACWCRLGVRPEDYKPQFVIPEVLAQRQRGIESFDEDAGFKQIGVDVVPFNVQLTMNNYTSADTCKIQIQMAVLPCDPRALRQVQIQLFGCVLMHEEVKKRAQLGGSGAALNLGFEEDPFTGNGYELFRGFAQDHTIKWGENDVIELNAVDLTAIFSGAELWEDSLKGIPKTARIDEVIQLLLYGRGIPGFVVATGKYGLPGARGTIIVNETGATLPRLVDIHPPAAFDSKGGLNKKQTSGSKKRINYWDCITELCKSAGLWCYVRAGRRSILVDGSGKKVTPGAELVITNPRTFYAAAESQEAQQAAVRRFLIGYNIDSGELTKRYTGADMPTTIEVRSYDPAIRRTRFARYPRKNLINRPTASGKGDREEIQVRVVAPMSGPGAVETLTGMAISLFEDQARREAEVRVRSKTTMSALFSAPSLGSDGTWNVETADMFWLRPGDPFEIGAAPADGAKYMTPLLGVFLEQSVEQRSDMYIKQSWPIPLAFAQANADLSPLLQKFFRVVRIEWTWDYPDNASGEDGGWSWEVEGRSYMDVRSAPKFLSDDVLVGVARG